MSTSTAVSSSLMGSSPPRPDIIVREENPSPPQQRAGSFLDQVCPRTPPPQPDRLQISLSPPPPPQRRSWNTIHSSPASIEVALDLVDLSFFDTPLPPARHDVGYSKCNVISPEQTDFLMECGIVRSTPHSKQLFVDFSGESNDKQERPKKRKRLQDAAPSKRHKVPLTTHTSSCCICLDDFARHDSVTRSPGCNHLFHQTCLNDWLNAAVHQRCPICRQDIPRRSSPVRVPKLLPRASSGYWPDGMGNSMIPLSSIILRSQQRPMSPILLPTVSVDEDEEG